MRKTRAVAFTALAVASAMVVAACGSTAQQGASPTVASNAPASSAAVGNPSASAPGTASSSGASGSGVAPSGSAAPSSAGGGSGDEGACGAPHAAYPAPKAQAGSVNVSLNEGITSWNAATAHGNSVYNAYPLYLTQALAGYYDSDLKFWDNPGFLTCKELSKDPVKVEYTINKAAKWSDGVPVTNADMLMVWAAQSGYYNTGEAQYDKDGNLVKSADIAFDSSSDAMHAIHHIPTLSADGQSMTVTYDDFYVDWQLSAPTGGLPAHVVAMKAFGESDATKATKD
ncbi:MAG: hypothetical protein ACR2P2_07765, partial [Nakamurella sp.]